MAKPVLVDAHMHLYESKASGEWSKTSYEIWEYGPRPASVRFSRYSGDLADAERAMTAAGYDYAVSVNLFAVDLAREEAADALPTGLAGSDRRRALADIDTAIPEQLRAFNRWACNVARRSGRIIPFVAVDPWTLPPAENAAHLRELAERHGARGVKLHPVVQRFMPNDPRMAAVYQECVDLGLIVLSHSGTAKGDSQYAEPRAFADLARAFPELRLVLAHLGGGSWRQTLELARAFPRLAFDCCEIIEWTGGRTPRRLTSWPG
jgi:predicted TIM-barrel fold metal-dependent hydrolase